MDRIGGFKRMSQISGVVIGDWVLRVERSVGVVPEPEDELQSVRVDGPLPPVDDGVAGQLRRVPRQDGHLGHGLWNSEEVVRSFAD